MRFRDFNTFNQSLLAKQVWRVLTDSNSLVAQIYKQRYFPSTNFLQAKTGNNPSYVWRSLLWGRDLLIKGLRWRIGDDTKVRVFQDPWFFRPYSFKPITKPNLDKSNIVVSDMINEFGEWDWSKVDGLLWEVDRLEVNRISVELILDMTN